MANNFRNKSWLYTLGSILSAFALMITTININTTCLWHTHQAELPKESKKLRKF